LEGKRNRNMNAVYLGSITILEPYVLLSDILLSLSCFYCYFIVKNKANPDLECEIPKYWRRFFLFEGWGFFIGGMAHGFFIYFGDVLHFIGWYAAVIGVFYFTWGILKLSWESVNKTHVYILIFVVAVSGIMATVFKAFGIIVAYCFLSMFLIISVNMKSKIISFKKRQSKGILIGTFLFICSAGIHIFRISVLGIASQITSHIIISIGILFFGKGCLDTLNSISQTDTEAVHKTVNI
jgi:hypothetical protein